MASAKKLPSGNWRVQVYVGKDENGKRIYESFTASTKREAERDAAIFAADKKRISRDRGLGVITFEKALEEHIEACRCAGMSPATIAGYLAISRNAFQSLMQCRVDRITAQDIQREINQRSREHSPKTIKNEFFLLRPVLKKYAPALDLSNIILPRGQRKEMSIPDDDDVRALLEHTKKHDRDLYIAILLASTLGLRRSEICALTWADINEDSHMLSIDKAMVRSSDGEFITKGTKTRAGTRRLFIADAAYAEIMQCKGVGQIVRINPNQVTERYGKLRDRLRIPGRFHDLRHYMASVMAALGVPEKYAVEIMGHATHDMLQRVYQHTMQQKRAAVSTQINTHTDALLSGENIDYATQKTTHKTENQGIASVLQ